MIKRHLVFTCILVIFTASALSAGGGDINEKLLKNFKKQFDENSNQQVVINAVTNNSIKDLALNHEKVIKHDKLFNHKLKSTGITNQKSSGRCWLYAGANVFSPKIMKKLQLSDFEISHSFLAFYDKLEKANFFLERIIQLRDKPLKDRSLQGQLKYFFGDGGWWHYFIDLTDKYGLVPKDIMPETKQSSSTGMLNSLGKTLLRSFASELRQMHQDGKKVKDLRKRKEEMLSEIYQLLVYNYGTPPDEFVYRYEFKDKEDTTKKEKEIIEQTYTPKSFFKEFYGESMPEYVAIVNNPSLDYEKLYKLEESRNVFERADFEVVNFSIEKLKKYAKKSLIDSLAVWFACDVGKENYKKDAIMATDIYDFNYTLNLDFKMTKRERLEYGDISPSHAMVLTGIDTSSSGQPVKWLVENSWGKKSGDDGFWYMYDDWFDEYVLMVIIDKNLLTDEDKAVFAQKPVIIEDWEPFFLALRNLE